MIELADQMFKNVNDYLWIFTLIGITSFALVIKKSRFIEE